MEFQGQGIDGKAAANWPAIQKACGKWDRFIVEVRRFDEQREISLKQMAYWHAVVVLEYSQKTGESLLRSEWILKRSAGRLWFMLEAEEEMAKRGQVMFECQSVACQNMFVLPRKFRGKYVCPNCRSTNIRLFFMLSKTELSVKVFNWFLENAWNFMESIGYPVPPPDPEWRINQKEQKCPATIK